MYRNKGLRGFIAVTLWAGLSLAAPLAYAQTPASEVCTPALWKVADADSELFIFGSFHVMKPAKAWYAGPVKAALETADEVWFETPVIEGEDPFKDPEALATMFSPTPALTKGLTDAEAKRFKAIMIENGLGYDSSIEHLRPWMAVILIAYAQAERGGAMIDSGIEAVAEREAKALKKPNIKGLESRKDRLKLDRRMGEEAMGLKMLRQMLRHYDTGIVDLDRMIEDWCRGDVDALARDNVAELAEEPEIYAMLLTDRNVDWIPKIETIIDGRGKTLLIVGAGHLSGPENVIDMLRARGHIVTRVQ